MKKSLLLSAALLCSLMASAGDGLTAVGANVILLPSNYWDGDIEWTAQTWVYNTHTDYGAWNTENINFNNNVHEPNRDAEGRPWYDPDYDLGAKEEDWNFDTDEQIVWEEHAAPFSSDETFGGRKSYRWTTSSVMADIYVRRTFTTDRLLAGPVYLACGHDDAPCEYYINGELVFQLSGWETDDAGNIINGWDNSKYILLTDEQKAFIKLNGEENVVAFHVHQNWGGAYADCGLYTKVEGGLDMGYTTPWVGKVIFNNFGGFVSGNESNNPYHPWSKLYEAQEGDEYSFQLNGSCEEDIMQEVLQFKTPIRIEEGRNYNFKARILTDKTFNAFIVQLGNNDDDETELAYEEMAIEAPLEDEEDYEGTLIDIDFDGLDVNNLKITFDFGGGEDSTKVTIKDISLTDISPDLDVDKELWTGTAYFNYFNMHRNVTKYYVWDETLDDGAGNYREAKDMDEYEASDDKFDEIVMEELEAPEIEGRKETMSWTQAEYDDSMWDDQMMPVGNSGYMEEVQTIWPGGDNTNYWIRRDFELDKINDRLSYDLNVCHDDNYETYVNGHLLQKNVGWTSGKKPVQVHIPAKYLNVGKNVIATYIQQNYGGRFYDCGINVTEVNYDECVKIFNNAIAYAQTDTLLTNAMKAKVAALIAEAKAYYNENSNDPVEIRNYARELTPKVNAIFAYSKDVKALKDTYEICRKMEDKGYWGTALEDAVVCLDTCTVPSQWSGVLDNLRYARLATNYPRHTEKFVGTENFETVDMEFLGVERYEDDDWNTIITPKYYLYNVGAKNFLGGGEAWGTHMALEYASNPMMIIPAQKEIVDEETGDFIEMEEIPGGYWIETFRPNGSYGSADFLNWNGFVDCALNATTAVWEIIPVEGKPGVFNIAQYGVVRNDTIKTYNGTEYNENYRNLIGLRNGDNAYAPSYYVVDTDMHDPNLETNQWMFISREEMLSFIKTADLDNPADLTFLIVNPGYDQRLTIDNWMFNNGSVLGRGGNHRDFVLESYNTKEFSNAQDIFPEEYDEALPAGTYRLSVQGYYRDGIEQAHFDKLLAGKQIKQFANIYAGLTDFNGETETVTSVLMPIHIEANKVPGIGFTDRSGQYQVPGTYNGQPKGAVYQAAEDYFSNGLYWNDLFFTIDEDQVGQLTIGIDKPYADYDGGDWIVMDNWRLFYYGKGDIDPDAIGNVQTDEIVKNNKAQKGIYNVLGQRLNKTQKGINIVDGKKIIKK